MSEPSFNDACNQGIQLDCLQCNTSQKLYLGNYSYADARTLLGLLDGSSQHYLFPPDKKCNHCGGKFKAQLFGFQEAS